MNVAITRAKRCVIIVGTAAVLKIDPMWNSLLDFVQKSRRMQAVERDNVDGFQYTRIH